MNDNLTITTLEDRRYLLLDTSELYLVNFDEIVGEDRKNNPQTQTIIKWDSSTEPSFVDSLTTKQGPYTNSEILEILTGAEWQYTGSFVN